MLSRFVTILALALLGLDCVLAGRLFNSYREVTRRFVARDVMIPSTSVSCADALGRRIEVDKGSPLALFVVHGDRVVTDLALWEEMQNQLSMTTQLKLLGVCDSEECRRAIQSGARRVRFPVASYASVRLCRALSRLDRDGEFALLDPHVEGWRSLKIPRRREDVMRLRQLVRPS